ncbi:unnamed protein product, partial [Prorocentrum cordatum]
VHSALTTDLPAHPNQSEEWNTGFSGNALVAKNLLGSMGALGSSFGEIAKTRALREEQTLVQAIPYPRAAWHEMPFFLEAEGDAAELLVKLQPEGDTVKFKPALKKSATAERLTQEVLDDAKSAMEKVRGAACADQDALSDLEKMADGSIEIAVGRER